jgi:hypothetical protein
MHAALPGSDGNPTTADMVRAIAPDGAIVFSMGTMELGFALDTFGGHTVNPQVVAFVDAALADLTRPAEPALVSFRRGRHRLLVTARPSAPDPRISRISVTPIGGGAACVNALRTVCRLPLRRYAVSYAAVAVDAWGRSAPLIATVLPDRWTTVEKVIRPG